MSQCGWQAGGSSLCLAMGNAFLLRKCYPQRILLLARRKQSVPHPWQGLSLPACGVTRWALHDLLFLSQVSFSWERPREQLCRQGCPLLRRGSHLENRLQSLPVQCKLWLGPLARIPWQLSNYVEALLQPHRTHCRCEQITQPAYGLL